MKKLPKTYMGYPTERLLRIWDDIARPQGTSAPEEEIKAMRALLKEYKLVVFDAWDKLKRKDSPAE